MSNPTLFSPLAFARGPAMRNRFMLAPLTNLQSLPDGRLSDDEYRWLTLRAEGGFGLTMTCAAHVQRGGQGFPGQLGVYDDAHLPGLQRLAAGIKRHGSLAVAQLHHAGMRSPPALIGTAPVCPSENAESGARALEEREVAEVIEAFVAAAVRCERAGFDGVELHGAHGYLLCQFLSPEINRRTDRYGGDIEARSRILLEIIDGIRSRCRSGLLLGVRLSPERYGVMLADIVSVARRLLDLGSIDFLDLSLWDAFKEPNEEEFKGRTLLSYFTALDRGSVKLGAAGKITTPSHCGEVLDRGVDFAILGRAGILYHDYPRRVEDPSFAPVSLPVSADHLRREGLGEAFVRYMRTWKGFVLEAEPTPTGTPGPGG